MLIESNAQLKQKLLEGCNKLCNVVADTLGPKGNTVILHKKDTKETIITKDGVTCANFIVLDDPIENIGAQILKQAAHKTNELAGDGSTTSTILANAIINASQPYLASGVTPNELKKSLEVATEYVVDLLKKQSTPIRSIKDIENIATISANNDHKIGKLIATAIEQIGKDGSITIKESKGIQTELEFQDGFRLSSGYISTKFINNEQRRSVYYDNPLILVSDHIISTVDEMMPVLEIAAREKRSLLIVAEDVENQALASLIMNAIRGSLKVAAIRAPGFGDDRINILEDLALSVGATFYSKDKFPTLQTIQLSDFGTCKTLESTRTETVFVNGKADLAKLELQVNLFKEQIKNVSIEEAIQIQERLTRLSCGVAIIHVGGLSDLEIIEKKHRIEDALEAVKSAQVEGMLPGGGIVYYRLSKVISDMAESGYDKHGYAVLREALKVPFKMLCDSIGESDKVLYHNLYTKFGLEDNMGVNFAKDGELIENMIDVGIIDSAKVARCALENAVSVAATLITTNYAVVG